MCLTWVHHPRYYLNSLVFKDCSSRVWAPQLSCLGQSRRIAWYSKTDCHQPGSVSLVAPPKYPNSFLFQIWSAPQIAQQNYANVWASRRYHSVLERGCEGWKCLWGKTVPAMQINFVFVICQRLGLKYVEGVLAMGWNNGIQVCMFLLSQKIGFKGCRGGWDRK